MRQYFELELGPNGDVFKGEVNSDGSLIGPALYMNKKAKLILVGILGADGFEGCCAAYDYH